MVFHIRGSDILSQLGKDHQVAEFNKMSKMGVLREVPPTQGLRAAEEKSPGELLAKF